MNDLDLTVEVRSATGASTRWDSDSIDPGDVPQALTFNTRRMHGFADAGLTLHRRIDSENADLGLLDEITIAGADGTTAYEGRVTAIPRSFDAAHSMSLQAVGWMSHAQDRKFSQVYVDRELSQWGEGSIQQRVDLIAAGYNPDGATLTTAPDATGAPGLIASRQGVLNKPYSRFVYDAGPGREVARLIVGSQALGNMTTGDTSLEVHALGWDADHAVNQVNTAELRAATGLDWTLSSPRRWLVLEWDYTATAGGTAGVDYSVRWQNIAVYGDHGLPLLGASPPGVAASDVICDLVARYCPKLNTAGVQQTTYPIAHLVFRDRVFPYDAFLDVNKYHLWDLSCWEGRSLHYGPLDYTDYDWEIRTDYEGTIIGLQGDSSENLASGVVVSFANVDTGQSDVLTPDDYPELRDDSVENPFVAHGYDSWAEYQVSFPTTLDAAVEIGRLALAELNAPKAPGTITKSHYIRDRAGHMQPVWKVRAGDRVAITSSMSLSDRPRIVYETAYNHDSRTVTMAIEGPLMRQEAINDRIRTAQLAANLT